MESSFLDLRKRLDLDPYRGKPKTADAPFSGDDPLGLHDRDAGLRSPDPAESTENSAEQKRDERPDRGLRQDIGRLTRRLLRALHNLRLGFVELSRPLVEAFGGIVLAKSSNSLG